MAPREPTSKGGGLKERRRGKASHLGAKEVSKRKVGLLAIVLQHNQHRKEEPSPASAGFCGPRQRFLLDSPNWSPLNYASLIMKAWNESGALLDTEPFDDFLCLASYTGL